MAGDSRQTSNPFSTGGGGANFETQVQALFAALMLAGGFAPCLPFRPIEKLILQAGRCKYYTDDLVVFMANADGSKQQKLLVNIKHSISLTKGDLTFGAVVRAAWNDYNNGRIFTQNQDAIALVTGPLSATDIDDGRTILEWARTSVSAEEFVRKVGTTRFSSTRKQQKLDALRNHTMAAAGTTISDDQLFRFLRHFYLLGYDLDVQSGVMHALLYSLIGLHAPANAEPIWTQIVDHIRYANQSGATLTKKSFSHHIRTAFMPKSQALMPVQFTSAIPPHKAPAWHGSDFGPALAFANLIGGWNENSPADMDLVAEILQGDVDAWLNSIREVLQLPDAPLTQQGGIWKVKNRGDIWRSLGSRVFDKHLENLRKCAHKALSERDARFDMDPSERLGAAYYETVPKYSSELRSGLAETLALLAAIPEPLTRCSPDTAASTATWVVRTLLEETDWKLWASLDALLPSLAEASPNDFLNAVDHALLSDKCPFDVLFSQEGNGIFGSNYMTGLLWALETLAWDERYLVRATVLLGALADRDPGGPWSNRPANSLTTIFLPWLPQTLALFDKQKVAVKTLITEWPEVGWSLLLSLMPEQTSFSTGSQKPKWMPIFRHRNPYSPSLKEYWQQISDYAEMAITVASAEVEKIEQLVKYLDTLPEPIITRVLELVTSDRITSLREDDRLVLWTSLSALVRKHRFSASAEWTLPTDQVTAIESAVNTIRPERPELVHRVLFSGDEWIHYEDDGNWEEQEKQLEARRHKAIEEIYSDYGVAGIIDFAKHVVSPIQVGYSLATLDIEKDAESILPGLLCADSSAARQFSEGFVRGAFRRGQWEWVDSLDTAAWSANDTARLLINLPFGTETWERAERLLGADRSQYWRLVQVNPYLNEAELEVAIDELLMNERPIAAIDCLARLVREGKSVSREKAIRALCASLSSAESISSMHSHHVVAVIQSLQDDPGKFEDKLVQIEWAYLPFLTRHNRATPKTLERRIASDSACFCRLIQMVYRSKKDHSTEVEPTEEEEACAKTAFHLLREWKTVPGMTADGGFCGENLVRWMDSVRELADESGHLIVALQHAGSVLIHSPGDPDGLWLHRSVAEVLNRAYMDELRLGYSIAVLNFRGAHFVDPTGEPELLLSQRYDQYADDVENAGYYRLALTFRGIAEFYRDEAKRFIAQAALEKNVDIQA